MERYERQIRLPGVGAGGQERLGRARVLLIGLGGLGSPAAYYLAGAGVGTIGVAERDRVDLSNLHRQILFSHHEVGESKLEAGLSRLRGFNPDVHFVGHPEGIHPENALDLVLGYDLVLDGSDNFGTRYLVNDACRLAGVPLVHGGIDRFQGLVTVFLPTAESPCYRCLYPKPPGVGEIPNCADAGVLGPLPGIVGSMMAMEALKLILGTGQLLVGRIWHYDALTARSRLIMVKPAAECPLCGREPVITSLDPAVYQDLDPECPLHQTDMEEISVEELASALRSDHPPHLLDVRQPEEVALCQLPEALVIPLGELSARWAELPRDRPLVVYCHHGMRSLQATRFLQARGLDGVRSLRGGIEQWSVAIDPSVARY